MRKMPEELREAYERLSATDSLIERRKFGEARDLFMAARAAARRAGATHPFISWKLAVVSDYMHEPEVAMKFVVEALEQDPLAEPFHASFDIITKRIRMALADANWDSADPATASLYRILVGEGEADAVSHLAMAKHLFVVGKVDESIRILDAVVVLEPGCAGAWELKAKIARVLGDEDSARSFEVESRALPSPGTRPWALPGSAQA